MDRYLCGWPDRAVARGGRARGGDMVRGGVRRWKMTIGVILSIHAPFSLPNHTKMFFLMAVVTRVK